MCLPAVAAIPLAIASSVASAAGSLAQGAAAAGQAKYEAGVAKFNAAQEVEAAHGSVLAGQGERRDFWRKVAQVKGQQVASMAANGIEVDYGSGARLQDDTKLLAADDAANLYKNIEQRTKGHLIQATNYGMEAKAAKARAKSAKIQGYFGAATSLLGGLSQAAGLKAKVGGS